MTEPDHEPRFATRLNSFRAGGASVDAALRAVAAVPGVSAVELNHPQHFGGPTPALALARDLGLAVTALNLRWDGPDFTHGAFTHPRAENRAKAVRLACAAAETAAAEGIEQVILWMGPDGFDQPFQADYRALWDLEIAGFRAVADVDPRVRVSVEPKPADPRRVSLVRTMADGLLAARDVGRANFGVTFDFCHLLMGGEAPAFAAAMALREGRLFGVHLNDGYGALDDGLPVASVHFWETLELLAEIRDGGFRGTIYFDTFPDRTDAAAECAANVATTRRLLGIVDRLPRAALAQARAAQDALGAMRLAQAAALGPET